MKQKHSVAYMACAVAFSHMSHAIRKKVGAVAVTPDDVMVYSWNGRAAGEPNECEDREYMDRGAGGWLDPETIVEQWPFVDDVARYALVTKPEVLHAEANIISKAAKSGISLKGSKMFITLAPCLECAKMIKQSGIDSVVYLEGYRLTTGIDYLVERGVNCTQYKQTKE